MSEFTHVITSSGERIALTELDPVGNAGLCASKVERADGSWSWAKSWWHPWDGKHHRLARIGAGAYGGLLVWKSDVAS